MNDRSFGRRGQPQSQFRRSAMPVEAVPQSTPAESTVAIRGRRGPLPEQQGFASVDDDLEQWKLARRQNFEIPWRPLWLLASLFFGVASFALPDSVNDAVDWLLYALAAASLWAGFRHRRRQAKIAN